MYTTGEPGHVDGDTSDRELVTMIVLGVQTQAAWSVLLSRYSALIYTVPRRYGLQESDAADVYQGVCEALWKNLPALRDVDRLAGWLLKVAGRLSWRTVMRRARRLEHERRILETEEPFKDLAPRPDDLALRREEWQAVARAVEALPARCRQLVWHLYYDPSMPSYEEIARRMNLAEGSIGPIRGRCLARLRQALQQRPEP